MNRINSLTVSSYYRLLKIFLPVRRLAVPTSLATTRNLFLYFDYEREFSGHRVMVHDRDILGILEELKSAGMKSTWFTVGKIFSLYPESVRAIISGGHELASHTFNHRPPLQTSRALLKKDFGESRTAAPLPLAGFHAPNGQWSLTSLRLLPVYGYRYDMVRVAKESSFLPFRHPLPWIGKAIRIHTLGDDWPLFGKKNTAEEAFTYFRNLFSQVKTGEMAGIGFHPWVLLSDPEIMKGFRTFLHFLASQTDLKNATALEFVNAFHTPAAQ
ncbi:MAG: polysaccharide deacetylase family protein [Bacteroidota bacterium]